MFLLLVSGYDVGKRKETGRARLCTKQTFACTFVHRPRKRQRPLGAGVVGAMRCGECQKWTSPTSVNAERRVPAASVGGVPNMLCQYS